MALVTMTALVVAEWHYRFDYSLGVLYAIPVLMASVVVNRWQIVAVGLLAAALRAPFTPAASSLELLLKFVMAATAYVGTGLLVVEVSNNRRRVLETLTRLQLEQELRRRAEEQLRMLADSSPAAIVTLDAEGRTLAANRAAHDILGADSGELLGANVAAQLPMFAEALTSPFTTTGVRAADAGWGRRFDQRLFPFRTWFSVYEHDDTRRLAAIVVDMSEEVRERERESFQHLVDGSRMLAGAVSHEIRNFCAAISVVCSNLRGRAALGGDRDFDSLVTLVGRLLQLASFELRNIAGSKEPRSDLRAVIDQLRVVIEPDWEALGGEVRWQAPERLPVVAMDAHDLLQICLNLCQNSLRSAGAPSAPRLSVVIEPGEDEVVIAFAHGGPGVAHPETLFQLPAARSANGEVALGLYVARELARSVGGNLEYRQSTEGAEFRVTVPVVPTLVGAPGAEPRATAAARLA